MTCTWPVDYAACATDAETGEATCFEDPTAQTLFESMAVEFLRNWTGRSFGLCDAVVRPCRENCLPGSTFWGRDRAPWVPALIGGQWYNIGCGSCPPQAGCGCTLVPALTLPGPIDSVTEILLAGAVLPDTAYRVDDHNVLVRLDGNAWPTCQDMGLGVDQPMTWQISYVKGRPVPVGGQVAAGILACELSKAACNDRTCALPQRIQNITRQGVSVTLLDDFATLQQGQTGIWLIDSWLASVTKPRMGASVHSVDVGPTVRRTTWTAPVGP